MEMSETTHESRAKVYEVGYLLLPTIPEEHIAAEVQAIKAVIEKAGGTFITEDFPKLRPLAYTMRQKKTGINAKYDKAYFGWVKFDIQAAAIPVIQREFDKNNNILRSMIISTVRENTLYTQKAVYRPAPGVGTDAAKPDDAPKMTEEEMDKTIENLVVV